MKTRQLLMVAMLTACSTTVHGLVNLLSIQTDKNDSRVNEVGALIDEQRLTMASIIGEISNQLREAIGYTGVDDIASVVSTYVKIISSNLFLLMPNASHINMPEYGYSRYSSDQIINGTQAEFRRALINNIRTILGLSIDNPPADENQLNFRINYSLRWVAAFGRILSSDLNGANVYIDDISHGLNRDYPGSLFGAGNLFVGESGLGTRALATDEILTRCNSLNGG